MYNLKLKENIDMAIKIYVDQGHNPSGYHNTGAEGFGLYEQDITYQIGIELAAFLNDNPNYVARVSRPTPETVLGYNNTTSLAYRTSQANEWGADYFISIHVNASTNPDLNGTECYVYSQPSAASALAQSILTSVVNAVGTKDNGVRTNSGLYVLRKTVMPAVLVETAYVTNESDAQKLATNQTGFAWGIYQGIVNHLG